MRFVYKVVLVLIVLVVIAGAVMGYRWYEGRTYVPTVTLPVVHDQTDGGAIVVESVAADIGQLWGLDFIPGTTLLLATEKTGQLFLIDVTTTVATPIIGVPAVATIGQGGLLDIAVSPDFSSDQTLFLTYAVAGEGGSATRLASVRLDIEAERLEDVTVLYTAPYQSGGTHFGARVVVRDAHVYVTLGDRGDKNFEDHTSQNTQNPYGSILRLYRDGSIPPDNPFVTDPQVLDEIYSYGHRNPQGLAWRPGTDELWSSEHGEFQGDEINRIRAGGNHGWPEVHNACSYVTRRPFGVVPSVRPDTVPPEFVWACGTSGFPPAGIAFYEGTMFSEWQGTLLVAGLAGRYLARFSITEGGIVEEEPLLKEEGWRVRDVVVGPDGAVYAAVEGGTVSLVRVVRQYDIKQNTFSTQYTDQVDRVSVVLELSDTTFRLVTNDLVRTGKVTTYRDTIGDTSGTILTLSFPSGEEQSYMQPDADSNRLYLLNVDEEIVWGSALVQTSD